MAPRPYVAMEYHGKSKRMGAPRILLVEDESDLAEPLISGLIQEGFEVSWANTGKRAIALMSEFHNLLILDLGLPDMKGTSVISEIKQRTDYPAILVLTARNTIQDKIELFELGCDDYLTKPFMFEELIQRIRALLRRSKRIFKDQIAYQDLHIDPTTHRAIVGDRWVQLTPKESSLLQLLMNRAESIVSKQEIIDHVWGAGNEIDTNFVGVHLFNIRKKLKEVQKDTWLQTLRNSGFTLCAPGKELHDPQN